LDRWRAAYAEAMIRTLVDCGLRLGELLALDCDAMRNHELHVCRTAWHGRIQSGTKTDHGEVSPGRVVPVARGLEDLLVGMPPRIGRGSELLFAGVRGGVWQESLFYRDVWRPAQEASGLDMRPHEARHSYVSLLRASGIDAADLAVASGHTLETATKTYTHALNRSADAIRGAVGGRI
jgi:integrase